MKPIFFVYVCLLLTDLKVEFTQNKQQFLLSYFIVASWYIKNQENSNKIERSYSNANLPSMVFNLYRETSRESDKKSNFSYTSN